MANRSQLGEFQAAHVLSFGTASLPSCQTAVTLRLKPDTETHKGAKS
jgi:hypothetical protein